MEGILRVKISVISVLMILVFGLGLNIISFLLNEGRLWIIISALVVMFVIITFCYKLLFTLHRELVIAKYKRKKNEKIKRLATKEKQE